MQQIQDMESGFCYVLHNDIDMLNQEFVSLIGKLLEFATNSKYGIWILLCITK